MMVWFVFRMTVPFEVVGVFSSEELALAACTHRLDFVGPITMDVVQPSVPWPGGYYPAVKYPDASPST
jgi:hypothetical protein